MPEKLPCAVCFLGPPASGKGTLAARLQDRWSIPIITPGDIFRVLREEDSDLGRLVRETMERYHHCPDDLTTEIVMQKSRERIEAQRASDRPAWLILDGYPRSFTQMEALDAHFDVALFLHVDAPFELLLQASINRRNCPSCGKVFSVQRPPEGPCPFRGKGAPCAADSPEHWRFRWDDGEEKYRERTASFQKNTQPIIDALAARPNYARLQWLGNSEAQAEIDRLVCRLDSQVLGTIR